MKVLKFAINCETDKEKQILKRKILKETVDIEIGNGFFMNDNVMELPL